VLESPPVRSDIIALEIHPGRGTLRIGTAIQLNLFGTRRGGGADLIPGNMAVWSSSNADVAEVNRQGRLNPRRPGTVTISAAHAGQVAHAVFTTEA
jgi:hypothetical protein